MKKFRVGAAVALGALLLMRFNERWFPVRVSGESMLPTLAPGDLLAVRPPRAAEPRIGQIVVLKDSERETVKRVVAPPGGEGEGIWAEGDNRSASTDSRSYGFISRAQVVGVVRGRYRPIRKAQLFR